MDLVNNCFLNQCIGNFTRKKTSFTLILTHGRYLVTKLETIKTLGMVFHSVWTSKSVTANKNTCDFRREIFHILLVSNIQSIFTCRILKMYIFSIFVNLCQSINSIPTDTLCEEQSETDAFSNQLFSSFAAIHHTHSKEDMHLTRFVLVASVDCKPFFNNC